MHVGRGAAAVVADAAAVEGVLVEVPGLGQAVGGVHGGALPARSRAVAPGVGRLGEGPGVLRRVRLRAVVRVVDNGAAVQRVGEGVAAAALAGLDGDLADVDAVAGAADGLLQLVLVQHRAAAGVHQHRLAGRRARVAGAGDGAAVGEHRHLADRPDHQLAAVEVGGAGLLDVLGAALGGRLGVLAGQLRRHPRDLDRALVRPGGRGDLAVLRVVHHQVAADHRQPAVGAVVPHVPGPAVVDQHVLRDQALVRPQAQRLRQRPGVLRRPLQVRVAARLGRRPEACTARGGTARQCGGLCTRHHHGAQGEGSRHGRRQRGLAVHRVSSHRAGVDGGRPTTPMGCGVAAGFSSAAGR